MLDLFNPQNFKILIIDDNENNLKILKLLLEKEGYNVDILSDGTKAFKLIDEIKPDLIILDIMMPNIDGFEICRIIKSDEKTYKIPIIIITALNDLEDKLKGIELGADEFLTKPINRRELLTRVKTLLKFKNLDSKFEKLHNVISSLAFAIDLKEPLRKGHSKRVGIFSVELSKLIGLSKSEIQEVEFGAYLHDVGKVGIPTEILTKIDSLTEEEYEIYKKHPILGYEICAPLEFMSKSLSIILYHHEKYNGTGFPDGLSKDQIPLGAQIVAIADSYDVMRFGITNKNPLDINEAIEILKSDNGNRFNPDLVEKFIKLPLRDIELKLNTQVFNSI